MYTCTHTHAHTCTEMHVTRDSEDHGVTLCGGVLGRWQASGAHGPK